MNTQLKLFPVGLLAALPLLLSACLSGTSSDPVVAPAPTAPSEVPSPVVCNEQSWFAGVTEWCGGVFVYRDYVYDDYGADAGLISPAPALLNLATRGGKAGNPLANTPGLLSPTAGDSRYPRGAESTADLVKLAISQVNDSTLQVVFELNALYEPGQTLAALAIDTDNNPATGQADVLGLVAQGADVVYTFAQGDPQANTITGTFPKPESGQWRVWAVTAQSNGTVMNVAFRGTDEEAGATGGIPDQVLPGKGNWWEDKQAAALGAGNITAFSALVNADNFTTGQTELAQVGPGFKQRVYTSEFTVPNSSGEGMTLEAITGRDNLESQFCGQYFAFLGKYQPYGIYIPERNGEQLQGAQLVLHGCEANHASQINQPNMQSQFGDELNRVLVAPLGRGPYGFYSDLSERDVLDVLADVQATLPIDDDQVFISGYSMGGYGALRLAALYPQKFAGVHNWVGFTGNILNLPIPGNPLIAGDEFLLGLTGGALPVNGRIGALGNVIDYVGNLRNIPATHTYGALDELVQVWTALALQQRLSGDPSLEHEFYLHPVAEHLTFIALDDWAKEAAYSANRRRVSNPAQVVYKSNTDFAFPEYGLVHNQAYWLGNMQVREPGEFEVQAESLACGTAQPALGTGQSAGNGPVPYVQTFRRPVGEPQPVAAQQVFNAQLRNVAAMTIDLVGSCLQPGAAYSVQSDGPVVVTLSDGRQFNLPAGNSTGSF